jgi:hypothetical protein
MNAVKHLNQDQLFGYACNSLDSPQAKEVGRHLLQCADCRNLLPAPSPQQFWSALLSETELQEKHSLQEFFPTQSLISIIFSPFRDRRGLAWSAGALIVVVSFSLLIWQVTLKQSNITSEFRQTSPIEINSGNTSVIEEPSNSIPEEALKVESKENPTSPVLPTTKLNKFPSPVTLQSPKSQRPEAAELAQLIEETPATVLSLRSGNAAILRKNSDNSARTAYNEINRRFSAKFHECVSLDAASEAATPVSVTGDSNIEIESLVRFVWQDICQMTLRQRRALLLHSQQLIVFLLRSGINDIDLAAILEFVDEEWLKIKIELPLSDLQIAEFSHDKNRSLKLNARSIKKARHEARNKLRMIINK